MIGKTQLHLARAGVSLVDADGKPVRVKAASWRSGGVQSAKLAGLSDGLIMALGRWRSIAWCSYLFATVCDLQKATTQMARAAASSPSSSILVGSFNPAGLFEEAP
jgi:hypothetical protein